MITQFICVIEIVQLQQSNKDVRILKAGANINITPKPHRCWSGFDPVFFIWHLQWFYECFWLRSTRLWTMRWKIYHIHKFLKVFKVIRFPVSAKTQVLHPACRRFKKDEKLDYFLGSHLFWIIHTFNKVWTKFHAFDRQCTIWPFLGTNGLYYKQILIFSEEKKK